MTTLVEEYLSIYATPEQKELFLEACRVLKEAGITDHESVLTQEIEIGDNLGNNLYAEWVLQYMVPLYKSVIVQFGIRLNDDTLDLRLLVALLKGLLCLDNWSDHEALYELCDHSEGPESGLAEMVALTTDVLAEDILGLLDVVDPALMERIAEINRPEEDLPEEPSTSVGRVTAVFPFIPETERTLCAQYLDNQGRVGAPFIGVVNQFESEIQALAQKPRELVHELMAFALISSTPNHELALRVMNIVDQLDLDVGLIPRLTQQAQYLEQKATEHATIEA